MKKYKHLTLYERERIAVWKAQGMSLRKMSARLGRHFSSLSREINRNSRPGYWPHKAQERANERERLGHKRIRLKSQSLRSEVEVMLSKGWSPELIAGRLRREHPSWPTITHEAIYQWIYAERPDLIGYLVCARPTRSKRWKTSSRKTRIPQRVSIQARPESVNRRQEPGHWETDLIVGRGKAALQVSVERKSRLTRIRKTPDKTARQSRCALEKVLQKLPDHLRRSVTYDNGLENAEHYLLNQDLKMRSWFCEPYHSWEKGQVENTNGLIRRFVPKRSNLDDLSQPQIELIENWLNNRPRKVIHFQTPNEVFNPWCCT